MIICVNKLSIAIEGPPYKAWKLLSFVAGEIRQAAANITNNEKKNKQTKKKKKKNAQKKKRVLKI